MKKIPTLYRRNPDDMKRVLSEVTPGCEWVIRGEGFATRKYDGTCIGHFDGRWWARREVKPGKTPPADFRPEMTDENTGKTVGWEPVAASSFAKFWREAIENADAPKHLLREGTYELCGPKINGNPEGFDDHRLVPHGVDVWDLDDLTYEGLRSAMSTLGSQGIEGVVWHHPDGRTAKLKARDFPAPTAPSPPEADR